MLVPASDRRLWQFFLFFSQFVLVLQVFPVFAQNTTSSDRVFINLCEESTTNGRIWHLPKYLANNDQNIRFFTRKGAVLPCENSLRKVRVLNKKVRSDADFTLDGYFRIQYEFYHVSEYCLQSISNYAVTINYCEKQCAAGGVMCVSACCPLGKGLHEGSCQPLPGQNVTSNKTLPYGMKVVDQNNDFLGDEEVQQLRVHYTQAKSFRKKCTNSDGVAMHENFTLQNENDSILQMGFHINGDLSVQDATYSEGQWVILNPDNYCVDRWVNEQLGNSRITVHVCLWNVHEDTTFQQRQLALGITLATVSVFPLLTFLVYLFILRQQNIHGLTVMSLSVTMFFMYIFLSVSSFINAFEDRNSVKTFRCQAIGFLGNYFFLSLFCWLTIICFDLWWTFRRIKPSGTKKNFKFSMYTIFGWGVPLVFVCTGAILDIFYTCVDTMIESCALQPPRYGEDNCYISAKALGIYLYYPAAILLVTNIGFFILTVIKLREYKASTKMATQSATSKRKIFVLCVKMFLVMGIFWIFEIISWYYDDHGWYWFAMDVLKSLQAVAIFVVFVCKKQTWEEVQSFFNRFRSQRSPPAVSTDYTLASK